MYDKGILLKFIIIIIKHKSLRSMYLHLYSNRYYFIKHDNIRIYTLYIRQRVLQ